MRTTWRHCCGLERAKLSIPPLLCAAALLGFVFCDPAIAAENPTADVSTPSAFKPGLAYDGLAFANLGDGVRPGRTYPAT
jgi:hypothetical protein